MPRQARTKSEFGIYHVMMRGINRQNIFDDEEDYFTSLFRHISQNPVKAGIVKNAAEYRWGSWNHDYLAKGDCGATPNYNTNGLYSNEFWFFKQPKNK